MLQPHPMSSQCRFVHSRGGVCDKLRLRRGRRRCVLSMSSSRGGVEMSYCVGSVFPWCGTLQVSSSKVSSSSGCAPAGNPRSVVLGPRNRSRGGVSNGVFVVLSVLNDVGFGDVLSCVSR